MCLPFFIGCYNVPDSYLIHCSIGHKQPNGQEVIFLHCVYFTTGQFLYPNDARVHILKNLLLARAVVNRLPVSAAIK